jgi:oligopeptide transport system substrate-binding protein
VTLDPSLAGDDASGHVIAQLFRGLMEMTPENDIVPSVASSWEVSEAGRRYVFHLRDDVRWSDGVPVTASDFAFAWKRMVDPTTASPGASELYLVEGARAFHQGLVPDPDGVGIRAIDDWTLEVRLEAPTGHFLHLLGGTLAYPVPRHVVRVHSTAWTEPENIVVNGPFLMQSWERGESMVLVRNPQYHGRFTGNVGRVEFAFSRPGQWAAQLEQYEAGGLDIVSMGQAPPEVAYRARQRHAGEYAPQAAAATLFLVFDVTRPPFDDRRVRQAFARCLDREALVEKTLSPYHLPATGGFVPPDMPGHTPGIALQYDAAQARQLLAEAGYTAGRDLPSVDMVAWPRARPHAACLQAQWGDALGVVPKLDVLEWAEFVSRIHTDPPQMYLVSWFGDYPDPDSFLRVALRRHTSWQHAAYDHLIEQAMQAIDQRQRLNLHRKAERILMEEVPIVPLCYEQGGKLVKPWIRKLPVPAFDYLSWKDAIIDPH